MMEALNQLAAGLETAEGSPDELANTLKGIASLVAEVAGDAGPDIAELLRDVPQEAIADVATGTLPGVPAGVLQAFAAALEDPAQAASVFGQQAQAAAEAPDDWRAVVLAYERASQLAIEGHIGEALELAILGRTRARDDAPEFVPRGSLTIGFVHEQAGDIDAARRAYEATRSECRNEPELAAIDGRACLGLARLLAGTFETTERDEFIEQAFSIGWQAQDEALLAMATVAAADVAAATGDIDVAIDRLVAGRAAIFDFDGNAAALDQALAAYAERFGEGRVAAALDRVDAMTPD